jgi:cysteine desulfurase
MESEAVRLQELRDWFFGRLTATIPGVRICGSRTHRMPNNIHFCLEGVQGEPVLLALDAAGICASAGSACSAGATEPSHVLKAICVPRETARGALRLTMGKSTDQAALEYVLTHLQRIVGELRQLSGNVGRA